jgi:hypothetical protein
MQVTPKSQRLAGLDELGLAWLMKYDVNVQRFSRSLERRLALYCANSCFRRRECARTGGEQRLGPRMARSTLPDCVGHHFDFFASGSRRKTELNPLLRNILARWMEWIYRGVEKLCSVRGEVAEYEQPGDDQGRQCHVVWCLSRAIHFATWRFCGGPPCRSRDCSLQRRRRIRLRVQAESTCACCCARTLRFRLLFRCHPSLRNFHIWLERCASIASTEKSAGF